MSIIWLVLRGKQFDTYTYPRAPLGPSYKHLQREQS